ncbi:SDR family NAD(P)-dependent oxidoreductase [Nguyenibacter sp. L1]|uniref:SDR family oxidoreductase n=1 Tax=Nguyenibacter sp. L1 TaxID=3049350 RepID=UPI002B49694D|nr:SDR family NAD(P)-dependent oxidoreductase [Nguyenibacter sp. L1]WRH86606.1 SDR family NAD(P)-dependent oxidoreductase [Nguyenibacter sp. L1]
MAMQLKRRTILITGGTSGIGRELGRQLLDLGNTVIVTGRDQQRLEQAARDLPGVHTLLSDVSDPSAVAALYAEVVELFPNLDTIINNAGIMRNLKLDQERSLADVTREIEIGLNGPIHMVQQFLPFLKTRKQSLIINVSSGLAFVPFPAAPVYSAAKAGLHAYTRCLRAQLESTGVTVVELVPPGTETPLFRGEFAKEMKGEKGMDPKVLVRRAIEGIEAGKTEIRPGPSNILKIASRLAPNFMFKQMIRLSQLRPGVA